MVGKTILRAYLAGKCRTRKIYKCITNRVRVMYVMQACELTAPVGLSRVLPAAHSASGRDTSYLIPRGFADGMKLILPLNYARLLQKR